jgi:CheY-like chemotaxis protein
MKGTILYVDDDSDDQELFEQAVKSIDPDISLVKAENGLKALDYLNSVKKSTLPCLVVLDLNMPLLDGRGTFEKIKEDPALHEVSIIIFTSSENPNDKAFFHNKGTAFISKPDNIYYLRQIAGQMLQYCN